MNDAVQKSSRSRDVDRHFAGRSENVRSIYDAILKAAHNFGEFIEDPKKTSIHLNRRSAFAGIRTMRDSLVLTIKSKNDIVDSLISKREQASANRWYHEIRINSADEIGEKIIAWLEQSYQMSG